MDPLCLSFAPEPSAIKNDVLAGKTAAGAMIFEFFSPGMGSVLVNAVGTDNGLLQQSFAKMVAQVEGRQGAIDV